MIGHLIFGTITGCVTGFMIICFINIFILPFRKELEWNAAVNAGRVITAKLIKCRYPTGDDYLTDNFVYGYYQYEYGNNRKKKILIRCISEAPETIELYYKKNPKRAKTAVKFGSMENGAGAIILCSIVFWILIFMIGG